MRYLKFKVVSGAVIGAIAGYLLIPKPELYARNGFSTLVVDRHDRLVALTLAPDERYRVKVDPDQIPTLIAQTVQTYEDQRYWWHPGVDPFAIIRAIWTTYLAGDRVVGGSTLTMQLARLRFQIDTRSILGKLTQIFRALQLERHYDKPEILAAYLTVAPYGGNIEGVVAASLIYFGKQADQLSLMEALALAVIPQNPSARNPMRQSGQANVELARARLFRTWIEDHPVDQQFAGLLRFPLAFRGPAELDRVAPHFGRDMVRANDVGTTIRSTLDRDIQAAVERLVGRELVRRKRDGIFNAAALVVDTQERSILAEVGSADFFDDRIQGQVNGTRSKRSPGSTLKPFVYGLAIDEGLVHPGTLMRDAPSRYGAFTPENFDRGFMGPITAQEALILSRNVPAVQLLSDLGPEKMHSLLARAEIGDLLAADYYGLALALGGNEVTMHELVSLYVALANGGVWQPLRSRIDDSSHGQSRPLLSREAAYIVRDMLAYSPRPGAGPRNSTTGLKVAWKTGTSYAYRDAWTVGIVGQFVVAVWVGNFDGTGNPSFTGLRAAAPLFFDIADYLLAQEHFDHIDNAPDPSLNLTRVEVCATTGDLPNRHCPKTTQAWFIPGVSPMKVSMVYREIKIDQATGLRACWDDANVSRAIYEVWPSDIAMVFRQAGIVLRTPPKWHPRCAIGQRDPDSDKPRILMPTPGVSYAFQPEKPSQNIVPLQASADGSARKVFWFVDDAYVGSVEPRGTLLWQARPGTFTLRATDDLGRTTSQVMTVAYAN